jgi:hypothetical protein
MLPMASGTDGRSLAAYRAMPIAVAAVPRARTPLPGPASKPG